MYCSNCCRVGNIYGHDALKNLKMIPNKKVCRLVDGFEKGKKRRQDAVSVHIDEGIVVNLSQHVAIELKKRVARQRKKPHRFGDEFCSQDMTAKTRLVCNILLFMHI